MSTATKERPFLFSGEMVRAILDGRKTMTRRVVKLPRWAKGREIEIDEFGLPVVFDPEIETHAWINCPFATMRPLTDDCQLKPIFPPGQRLWVRECWGDRADYAAIGSLHKERVYYAADGRKDGWKYRPSIHMPRWASRITLEITDVRVERLQSIHHKADELESEGIDLPPSELYPHTNRADKLERVFIELWNKLNGDGSWNANPWVWVISFKRIKP